jgi:hypothetical protein
MTLGQRIDLASFFNRKPSRAVTTLQIFESVDRDSRSAGSELQKTALLLGIPGSDDLPEVLDHLVLFLVATVVGVLLPVVDIDIGNATNEKLELTLVKYIDEVGRDKLIEARDEGVELFLYTLGDFPLCDKSVMHVSR